LVKELARRKKKVASSPHDATLAAFWQHPLEMTYPFCVPATIGIRRTAPPDVCKLINQRTLGDNQSAFRSLPARTFLWNMGEFTRFSRTHFGHSLSQRPLSACLLVPVACLTFDHARAYQSLAGFGVLHLLLRITRPVNYVPPNGWAHCPTLYAPLRPSAHSAATEWRRAR